MLPPLRFANDARGGRYDRDKADINIGETAKAGVSEFMRNRGVQTRRFIERARNLGFSIKQIWRAVVQRGFGVFICVVVAIEVGRT